MKIRLFIKVTIVILSVLAVLSCEKDDKKIKPEFPLEQPDKISDEDYDIYSLVINELYSSERIVIKQKTETEIYFNNKNPNYNEYFIDMYPDYDSSLVQTHEELNKNSSYLGNQFKSSTKEISLMSTDELYYIFNSQNIDSDWNEFYKDYKNSNGIISFTRIAYNEDRSQAIFEIWRIYASLGGDGYIVYLKKVNGNWTIIDVNGTWAA